MQGILLGLSDVLEWLLWAVKVLVVLSALVSLLGSDPANPIVRMVRTPTEPVYRRMRKALPFLVQGAWDLSPIAVFLICLFLDKALVFNLRVLAAHF